MTVFLLESTLPTNAQRSTPAVLVRLEVDRTVPEIPWMVPGEAAAAVALREYFSRIGCYSAERNDPSLPGERRTGV